VLALASAAAADARIAALADNYKVGGREEGGEGGAGG
jgi:hypothetical protein